MKVLVLGGGNSPEREVSLRSAGAVAAAAKNAGFEVMEADPKYGYGIFDGLAKDTLVFPILHGAGGEDGEIQAELEKRKLAYLGSDSKSSANCFDKWKTRQILELGGIPMPKAARVNKDNYTRHPLAQSPHVLKVLHGGSSIGTLKVSEPKSLSPVEINEIFNLENDAVIEELIEGTEITIPILDMAALPVIEIVPPPDGEFDYENKYNGRTQELCPPVSVSEEVQQKAQSLSEEVHRLMDCRHLSRVDIMLDARNNFYVLEINTIPGMTDQSLYPRSAKVAGLAMPEMVKKFVSLIERDYDSS
jgi:D-alanine-D-alanine ligase